MNTVRNNGWFKPIHGMSRTRLHRIWHAMKSRCFSSKHPHYKLYGGRGISVCDAWLNFATFAEWALQNGYRDDLTIERKDGNLGYAPDNCTWATYAEQAHNRRDNRKFLFAGESLTLREWARRLNTSHGTLMFRLKRGWTVEQTLGTSVGSKHARYHYVS